MPQLAVHAAGGAEKKSKRGLLVLIGCCHHCVCARRKSPVVERGMWNKKPQCAELLQQWEESEERERVLGNGTTEAMTVRVVNSLPPHPNTAKYCPNPTGRRHAGCDVKLLVLSR